MINAQYVIKPHSANFFLNRINKECLFFRYFRVTELGTAVVPDVS